MPDTIFALSVLIILVIPGVVFAVQVDNHQPARELSSLRELAAIAGVGVLCDSLILLGFGIIRVSFPRNTPDVGSIERLGFPYVRLHYVSIGWWFIGLLLTSCGLAYMLGRFRPQMAGRVASGSIRFTSAWWELFHIHQDALMYVGCELQDGSYIAGYLLRYSAEVDETPDREIALSAPITYRTVGSDETVTLDDVNAVMISASQIKFVTVTYISAEPALASSEDESVAVCMQVLTTTDSAGSAETLAHSITVARLAACVQITGPIESIYRREGKPTGCRKWQLTMKTTSEKLAALEEHIKIHDGHSTPEIIAEQITWGNEEYLKWIRNI